MIEQSSSALGISSLLNVTNDIKLSIESFEKWRSYIYEKCGIYFQDNKKYLLESRLQKRIKFLGLETFEQYLDYLKTRDRIGDEHKYLYEAITINETFFFRNQPQLEALISKVIPEIIAKKEKTGNKTIKIWSAASSSGEEAYSVAMIIDDLIKPTYPNYNYEIIGTDLSQQVINTAKSGNYKEYSVRQTPSYYLKKYFKMNDNSFQLDSRITNMVKFKILNLYDDLAMKSMINYDIIFCANVLIYFDLKSKIKVVSHLYNSLNNGGYLFIGYSETLHSISKAFQVISFPKTIGYKKE
ncbi:MAG: protein-glutamate O-methyltransferase CheR [Ignavibacteriales bacterium]|jgi:chemotaxis protein methyltransferase CheR|nr:protein-glutamate O-methyltransferase CheR [Melioribacteraceae bacterium]RJP56719.1 MAG: protein-glutamate O-methyltransferase CheR [Ignavibacteriales bacterium]